MLRRIRVSILLVLIVVASCTAGATPVPSTGDGTTTTTPRPTPTAGGPILAIGDSLLFGAQEHGGLDELLVADGWVPEVLAEHGRSTRWAVGQVEARRRVPRRIVLVLGSNPGFSSAGFAAQVQELRDALVERGAGRIFWLPPHHPDPERYREQIRILTEADRADNRLVVPDWGAVLDAHPEWINSDGVHLSESGYTAMAEFIRDTLARLG